MSEDDKPRGERAVKAKLPAAKNIRSPEFKPHGISGGSRSRGPRPSGKTAAQAKKQRRIAIALTVVAVLAIAGGTTYYLTRPRPVPTATGALGQAPKVTFPEDLEPTGKLEVHTTIRGKGPKVANGDTAMVKFAFYKMPPAGDQSSASPSAEPSESPKAKKDGGAESPINSSYQQPAGQQAVPMTVGKTDLKGLDKALVGAATGSRLVVEIPPKEGFGDKGQQIGLGPNDSIVFVVDVLANYSKNAQAQGTEKKPEGKDLPQVGAVEPGKGPKVTMPKADPPEKMRVETLIEGTGPETTKDDTAIVKYKGLLWRNGKEFDSNWNSGPTPFPLNSTEGMTGFFKGLQGKKIGSRVMLILPPKDGYGKEGNPQAGIKGDDYTVFVVDILGTMPK
ncbi:FKBP-type peptidyl-prolyl cis-trans isomerase [Spirillospora sp. NPDC029432]|uniref:FKBP-type peptidyl-prolyl cis-trans isomerase n=1 Tax=Spirillospora sp. NPDC029432 TaxID=3154599 RepID=UPI0034543D7B